MAPKSQNAQNRRIAARINGNLGHAIGDVWRRKEDKAKADVLWKAVSMTMCVGLLPRQGSGAGGVVCWWGWGLTLGARAAAHNGWLPWKWEVDGRGGGIYYGGGDQNLGFNSFVYSYCSYVRKLGSMLTTC